MPEIRIIVSLGVIFWSTAYGQDQHLDISSDQNSPIVNDSSREELKDPIFNSDYLVINVHGGIYQANEDSQLVNLESRYAGGVSAGVDFNRPRYLGIDIELLSISQKYDTPTSLVPPVFGTIDHNTSIDTTALLLGVRGFYQLESRLSFYGVFGLGYYRTLMEVRGSTVGLPAKLEETDTSIELYYGAGASYMFGNWGVSLNYRHITLNSSFGDFNVTNADLGGDTWLLGWRYVWSQ